jgi:hypothetical protein
MVLPRGGVQLGLADSLARQRRATGMRARRRQAGSLLARRSPATHGGRTDRLLVQLSDQSPGQGLERANEISPSSRRGLC